MGDQPCCKAATYTEKNKHRRNADISMPRVGFEPMIAVFERAKKILLIHFLWISPLTQVS
jgi:hypothetical protein